MVEKEKEFQKNRDQSYNKIPKFFEKSVTNENNLNFKVRQEG